MRESTVADAGRTSNPGWDTRVAVRSPSAPPSGGPYSQAIRLGSLLFLAGQAPVDQEGAVRRGTVAEQTLLALENLEAVAKAAGGSMRNAVRVGVYLSSLEHFGEMNATYREFFVEPFPARTTIQSEFPDFDVEIDAIVWLGS